MSELKSISSEMAKLIAGFKKQVVGIRPGGETYSSGFFVKDSYIVTSASSLQGSSTVEVVKEEGPSLSGTVEGFDQRFDIALIKVTGETGFSADAVVADPTMAKIMPEVGNIVIPLGRPGRSLRAAFGFVSAVGESYTTPVGGVLDVYIETDGNLPYGFTGGPLIDASGNILGMNTMAMPRHIGMTVPISNINKILTEMEKHGGLKTPYLGVNTQPVKLHGKVDGYERGLLITEIARNSPAEKQGLFIGDTILKLDNRTIETFQDLLKGLNTASVDETVDIHIYRSGNIISQHITLGEKP